MVGLSAGSNGLAQSATITNLTITATASRGCSREGRAQVRRMLEPNPLASMAIASLLPRRTANTSSTNAIEKNRRSAPRSPTPRARRARPMLRQSSTNSPSVRVPASTPNTNLLGRRATCASASASSVGSVRPKSRMVGSPSATTRSPTATASAIESSLIVAYQKDQ